MQPDDLIDVKGGSIRFGNRVIRDTHDHGVLSFADVIVKSSNVGAIKVGLQLGAERMAAYVARFGFGRPTSPDFRGENPGIARGVAKMKPSALASVAMGYEIGVTPLQMAAAVSSVANGGELIEPRLVRAVIRGAERATVPRKVLGRTISASTAKQLTEIMEAVVTDGTGTAAQIEGYTMAGKTGTASKIVNGTVLEVRLQRLVRRLRAVPHADVHDRRGHRFSTRARPVAVRRHGSGADLPADCRRTAAASGRAAVGQPGAAGARRAARSGHRAADIRACRGAGDRHGGGHDRRSHRRVSRLAGMGARDAVRMLARLG